MNHVVAWSAAARKELQPEHPAYADNNPHMVRGVWHMTRECEHCGVVYTKPMELFETVSWDTRGILSGLCDSCAR